MKSSRNHPQRRPSTFDRAARELALVEQWGALSAGQRRAQLPTLSPEHRAVVVQAFGRESGGR